MKRSWLRKIIGGLSFTTALFVFQACYGSVQDFGVDCHVAGKVRSKTTGSLLKGIKVSVADDIQYELTDESGRFTLYTAKLDKIKITFEDIDGPDNGLYSKKDTIVNGTGDSVYLEVSLEGR